jgi:hypothetical protein
MIHTERMTARREGDFAVLLIGMRINRPLAIHKWYPVIRGMTRMLKELYSKPELGLLSHEMWFSRTVILVQYWRSVDALMEYATARDSSHLPQWRAFNRAVGSDGSGGIWHETHVAKPRTYENIYVNMPAFGLGKAGTLVAAKAGLQSAAGRLHPEH